MHTRKTTPDLLFEYRCTSGKFIRSPNRIESNRNFLLPELECSTSEAKCDRKQQAARARYGCQADGPVDVRQRQWHNIGRQRATHSYLVSPTCQWRRQGEGVGSFPRMGGRPKFM